MDVREYHNHGQLLFPPCIGDYLRSDHLAWIIDEVIGLLDLSKLYKKIPTEGNSAYDPKMMLKVLFYGYTNGVFSSRKIEKRLANGIIAKDSFNFIREEFTGLNTDSGVSIFR